MENPYNQMPDTPFRAGVIEISEKLAMAAWLPCFGRKRGKQLFLGNQASNGKPHYETCHEMVSEIATFFPTLSHHMI
jgi:hypothetical protein